MRRAKNAQEQVKVLAELNACSEAEVRTKIKPSWALLPPPKSPRLGNLTQTGPASC